MNEGQSRGRRPLWGQSREREKGRPLNSSTHLHTHRTYSLPVIEAYRGPRMTYASLNGFANANFSQLILHPQVIFSTWSIFGMIHGVS